MNRRVLTHEFTDPHEARLQKFLQKYDAHKRIRRIQRYYTKFYRRVIAEFEDGSIKRCWENDLGQWRLYANRSTTKSHWMLKDGEGTPYH